FDLTYRDSGQKEERYLLEHRADISTPRGLKNGVAALLPHFLQFNVVRPSVDAAKRSTNISFCTLGWRRECSSSTRNRSRPHARWPSCFCTRSHVAASACRGCGRRVQAIPVRLRT